MADQDRVQEAMRLAARLRATVGEIRRNEAPHEHDVRADPAGPWLSEISDGSEAQASQGVRSVIDDIETLDGILQQAGFNEGPPQIGDGDFFSLGTIGAYGGLREIHRGFVQPVLRLPVATRIPDRVVAFLVKISGDDEWLDRENHSNLGYHYHYLNAKRQRSAVVICWDTRATPQVPHPLFQEKHGEAHSQFSGRPDLWGEAKRTSIHEACAPDLKRWSLDKFRMASNTAGPVWPLGTVLTPRAAPPSGTPLTSAKGRLKRR